MKTRIMEKAMELLNRQGVKFTMADLARELGVSKRALYEHYESKDVLIGAITDTVIGDMRRQVQETMADKELNFTEKLRLMLVTYPNILGPIHDRVIDDIQRYMPQEWQKTDKFMHEKWEIIEACIQEGIDSKVLRPVDMRIIRRIFLKANSDLFDYTFLVSNRMVLQDALAAMADLLIGGLIAEEKKDR